MARTTDEEIAQCFKDHPELQKMTLNGIARFFLIQGELRYSSLRQTLESKVNFYRSRLHDMDPEFCKKMDDEYRQASSLEKLESLG